MPFLLTGTRLLGGIKTGDHLLGGSGSLEENGKQCSEAWSFELCMDPTRAFRAVHRYGRGVHGHLANHLQVSSQCHVRALQTDRL